MELNFTKLAGAGNDFIFIEQEKMSLSPEEIRRLCARRFGAGADGVVNISRRENWTMEIWNADGTLAGMCGNALRCTALYLDWKGYIREDTVDIDTEDGLKRVEILERGRTYRVRADLGKIRWNPEDVPVKLEGSPVIDREISVNGKKISICAVSMGNPHCVYFTDDLSDANVLTLGPLLEHHPLFPDRCNVEFTRIIGPDEAEVRVWERGCGETMACGTGSAAVCAAASESGRTGKSLLCHMRGGDLTLERTEDGRILKTGPAELVYRGTAEL